MSDEVVEIYHPDRTGWPPGAWDDEGDREDFVEAGLACFIQRNASGTWCGYAGVPADHPDYGQSYDGLDIDVHGGLTYADECDGHLCHVPAPGMPGDVWWFGFDCNHYHDISPQTLKYHPMALKGAGPEKPVYRNAAYAIEETRSLARQLAKRE